MIGQIRGIILEKKPPLLLVEVQGIAYEIEAPMSTFFQSPEIGEMITLYTHLNIREDAHQLYGFFTKDEKQLFRALIKVNGIGPKLALTILSSVKIEDFIQAICHNDAQSLTDIPGIGKKTAERLLIEMRDKLSDWVTSKTSHSAIINSKRHQIIQDAVSALVSLGYKHQDANRQVTRLDNGKLNSEELIKLALQERI